MNERIIKDFIFTLFEKAKIVLNEDDRGRLEIVDFGLGNIKVEGLQLITYINTERYCAKDLALLPIQTCPQHRHPPRPKDPLGKQETFRCRYGVVHLFVEGEVSKFQSIEPPKFNAGNYTAGKQITLHPGEQYTIAPNTKHWFQAGPEGAIISEFSSQSDDQSDIFTDSRIIR